MEKNPLEKQKMKPEILISSCLVGCRVKYDGGSNEVEGLRKLLEQGKAIAMCPEIIGGLPIPREPAEIEPGRTAKQVLNGEAKILNTKGEDVTKEFIDGAKMILDTCKRKNIKVVILKEGSPSCGSSKVYDGTFTGKKISRRGVTAELLTQNGITVYCEHNFPKELL
ncbi:MAG: DUF523 domain-containing protein [Candidatus Paceibacterota bacterium]